MDIMGLDTSNAMKELERLLEFNSEEEKQELINDLKLLKMKVNLKDNIWIEGFDSNVPIGKFDGKHQDDNVIYFGATSEIPEEIARLCMDVEHYGSVECFSYKGIQLITTATKAIQSACSKPYCIIYKEN